MNRATRQLVALGAIVAPAAHTATDAMEWMNGGFTPAQLWLNYAAFLPLPAIMLGLYAVQRPRISMIGLVGALLYGFAFVYFTHTTLAALAAHVPDYDQLWDQLGVVYTVHGVVMLIGGGAFAYATIRARVFPAWCGWLFLAGLTVNLLVGLLPLPDLLQTIGTTVRNAGLVAMGIATWRDSSIPEPQVAA
jgi:hypothetical protein